MMVRSRAYSLLLTLMLAAPLAVQGQTVQPVTQQQRPLSWVPQGFEVLGQRAAFHTDFTFDRSMLQLAGYFMGDADQQTRNAIAKLDGISVHSYHFAAPGLYNPAALEVIRRQYDAAGWKHLVTARGKGDPFNPGQTDLWINFAHMNVTGMMVLFTGPRDLNLIALNGAISPLDLLHLRGHFGIPRFSGDGFVPGPSHAARPPYAPPTADPEMTEQAPENAPATEPPSQEGPLEKPSPYSSPGVGVGVGGDEAPLEPAPPPPIPPGF